MPAVMMPRSCLLLLPLQWGFHEAAPEYFSLSSNTYSPNTVSQARRIALEGGARRAGRRAEGAAAAGPGAVRQQFGGGSSRKRQRVTEVLVADPRLQEELQQKKVKLAAARRTCRI